MKGNITIDTEMCKGCKFCVEYCPKNVIHISENFNVKGYYFAEYEDDKDCTGCATCAVVCPEAAIEVYRE